MAAQVVAVLSATSPRILLPLMASKEFSQDARIVHVSDYGIIGKNTTHYFVINVSFNVHCLLFIVYCLVLGWRVG